MDNPIRVFYQMPPLPRIAHIAPLRPLTWLRLGWEDLRHNPGPSIAHGLILVAVGWLMLLFLSEQIHLLAAAVSVICWWDRSSVPFSMSCRDSEPPRNQRPSTRRLTAP